MIDGVCLSTTHAEYVGLTNALRQLIPIRNLLVEVLGFLELDNDVKPTMACKVFEDNQSAYLLATTQKLSPRTKYFCVKHHWFWSYVYDKERNPDGWVVVEKCPTNMMNADYLTKGLVCEKFEKNRLRLQGF